MLTSPFHPVTNLQPLGKGCSRPNTLQNGIQRRPCEQSSGITRGHLDLGSSINYRLGSEVVHQSKHSSPRRFGRLPYGAFLGEHTSECTIEKRC